ncbi:MAG: transaldolase [Ectothiorhodospiraceae bacterium]|nr:transaldolase [Ectothiorhodospiraceae bacterium]MCH8505446.1 transaldolase [Ectothiorhodospiraceae bacterium]
MSTANPLQRLNALGQSIWYDNIHRDMLDSGTLEQLVREDDLRGITSNPTIFDKAISSGDQYDQAIARVLRDQPDINAAELFNHLAVADIRDAADVMRPVYERTGQQDGYVSIEVSPRLAHDTEGTVEEARRLHAWLDRPNVMIKVPATREGIPAIETLISEGISINVTLLFSVERYRKVVDAFIAGLQDRARRGLSVSGISSVASFFVSRVDSAVDPQLSRSHADKQGKVAIANAKLAYRHFLGVFDGERFRQLRELGAQEQRLLWASTGTKNPAYSDVLYVDSLIGERTVNTVPPATYEAYRDHGDPAVRLTEDLDAAVALIQALPEAGVQLADITDQLEVDGVKAFADSFDNLLAGLERKAGAIARDRRAAG